MAEEKKIHYLMDDVGDFPLGRTYDELVPGDFVEVDGAIHAVTGDSGNRRVYHEVYLCDNFPMMLQMTKNPRWRQRLADFLHDRSKFEIKKVKLIE